MGFKKKTRERRETHHRKIVAMQKKLVEEFERMGGELVKHHIVLGQDGNPVSVPHIKLPIEEE